MFSFPDARTLARAVAALGLGLATVVGTPAAAQTIVGDGTETAVVAPVCPRANSVTDLNSVAVAVDAFTLAATPADTVTSVRVELWPANAYQALDRVQIRSADLATIYGSVAPTSDMPTVNLTTPIAVGAAQGKYVVAVVPKSQAGMPAGGAGIEYAVKAYVNTIFSSGARQYLDATSAIATIDNLPPADVVWSSIAPGATNITLTWAASQSVVVVRSLGGPVTDTVSEGATYTASTTLPKGGLVVFAGTAASFNDTGLTAGKAYYYKVFAKDACGNFSTGSAIGPIRPGGTAFEGDSVKGSRRVVVGLLNPAPGPVASPFRVQVRVFSPKNASGATQAIGTVELVAENGTTQQVFTLERNGNFGSASDSGIFEELAPTVGVTLAAGKWTLRARATSAADAVTPVYSGSVGITVAAASDPKGSGKLLVRDDSSQLCSDCHASHKTHSSEVSGTTYGSWYVGCRGCHDPHGTPNASLVAKQITPPSVTGQYPPTPVYFAKKSGYSGVNGAQDPANASFTNLDNSGPCQVCHTQTSVWKRTATAAENAAAGANHNGTQQCTACHAHGNGLAASCTSCHGNDALPTPFATGADSLVKAAPPKDHLGNLATTARGVGGHQAHVNKAALVASAFACTECHAMPNTHDGQADPLPFGPLAKRNGLAPSFDGTTCSNTWCHGAGMTNAGGTNKAPSWTGGASQATCGTCHGVPPPVSASPGQDHPQNVSCGSCHTGYTQSTVSATAGHIDGTPTSPNKGCVSCHGDLTVANDTVVLRTDARAAPGSNANAVDTTGSAARSSVHVGAHGPHVNAGMMTGKTCVECHAWPADGDTTHADGNPLPTFPAGGISRTAGVTAAFATPANTCATYCHSNGAPVGGSLTLATPAPVWTSTGAMSCTACHAMGGAATTLSSAHKLHTGAYAIGCQACHERSTTNGTTILAGGGLHVNGAKDVFDAAGTKGVYNGDLTCSNTYCHSSGADRTAPYVSGPSIAWTATASCTSCHGGPVGAGQMATGKHGNHVNVAGTIGGPASSNYVCGACHSSTVAATVNAPITATTGTALHTNGNPNVVFSATYGGTFTPGAAEGQGSCASTYCHSSGEDAAGTRPNAFKTVTWNGAALACNGCHGAETGAGTVVSKAGEPNYPSGAGITDSNSHAKHVASAADCVTCHADTVNATGDGINATVTPTLHLNKTRDVKFSGLPGTPSWVSASKTCSSVSCHGAGAPVWGGAALACTDCHLSASADLNSWNINDKVAGNINSAEWTSNGHGSAAVAFGAGNTCLYCHDDSGSTHNQATNPFRLRGAAAVGGATAAFNAGVNLGNAACLNCHGTASNGVKPGALAIKNGAKKVNANHYGAKHGATNNGGQRCWDCHDPHGDTNARMVGANVLAAAADVYGLGGTRVAVSFTYATPGTPAWADYVKTVSPFNGVCNACHGVSGSTPAAHFTATSSDAGHNAGTACMNCHAHEQGTTDAFKPNGACNACHGSPPTTGEHTFHVGTAGGTNVAYGDTTPKATAAAYAFSCGKCHSTVAANHMNSAAAGTSGAPKITDVAFDWASGATPYTVGTATTDLGPSGTYFRTSNGTCATYCHSNGAPVGGTATYAAPTWAAATLTCTSCHGNGVTNTATMSAKHARHVSTTTGYSYTCNKCHQATTANGTTIADRSLHVNNVNDLKFDAPSAAGAYAQGPSYTCSSVYCHSDGQPLGAGAPTFVTGLNWSTGTAMNAECTSCHGGDSTATGTKIASNKHAQHVNQTAVLGTNYGCVDCHNTTVSGNRALLSPPTTHVNGTKQVGFPVRGTQTSAAYASPTCASNYCHSNGRDPAVTDAARYATVAWNQAGVLGCNGCHGRGNATGAPDYADGATLADGNTHAKHTNNGADATTCEHCHTGFVTPAGTAIAGASHTNGTRNVAILAAYDTNGATINYATATKTCSSVSCHGTGTPVWGGAALACSSCHTGAADVNNWAVADGTISVINNGTEWTTYGHGNATATFDEFTGATDRCAYCHDGNVAHAAGTNPFRLRGAADASGVTGAYNALSAKNGNEVCLNCHDTTASVANGVDPDGAGPQPRVCQTTGGVNPCDLKVDSWHSGGDHLAAQDGGKRCWDCHDPHGDATNLAMIGSDTLRDGADDYGLTGTRSTTAAVLTSRAAGGYTNTTTRNGICQVCHTTTAYWQSTSEPTAHNVGTDCMSCHAHHQPPNFAFKGFGDCIGCHNGTQTINVGPLAGQSLSRRNVVAEFANTWSHKRSAGGTVTKWDCIVCHLEGDPTTGDPLDAPAGTHKNGLINLRDPDLGTNIKGVTFSGAPGSYAPTAVDAAPARFSRNLASAAIEPDVAAIMINQCLKCHDADGATSPDARVPVAQMPNSAAAKPFGTTISGTAYTGAGVTAGGVTGGVTDVKASFATSNSSYHPVLGKQNNWYSKLTRMVAPWNVTTRGATVNATSWGDLISCWDCHALPTDTGTITMTVTAHGAAQTLRGTATSSGTAPTAASAVTLCNKCHARYNFCGGATDVCGSTTSHGSGSAFSTNPGRTEKSPFLRYACNKCHASGYTTAVARPVRAQDVHGFDRLAGTGADAMWPTGATESRKPYAFIRNTSMFSSHQPAKIGATTYTPTCVHLNDSPCTSRTETYGVGGTY
jgi:predicted CxxxxCH...CXXCH cytochrome family protein